MKKLLSIILSVSMLLSSAIMVSADELFITTTATEVTAEKTTEIKGTIKVAINAEFAPFEYYENDELKGFDIELMNTIGEYTGYEVEYVNMDFDNLIPAVVSGEVDCAISAITVTDERDSVVDFTRPYLSASIVEYPMDAKAIEYLEDYAIVFPENSIAKSKTSIAAGKDTLYAEVDNAIEVLKESDIIDDLIYEYKLNEVNTDPNISYSYFVLRTTTTDDNDAVISENPSAFESIDTTPIYLPSDWAAESVENAKNIGIIDSTKLYEYQKPITREEFCEIVYSYINIVLGEYDVYSGTEINITDTDSKAVEQLVHRGIITGKEAYTVATDNVGEQVNTTLIKFAPKDTLTREEAAVILERMVNKTIPVDVTEKYFEFDDIDDISDWADSSIQTICNMGVMNGVGNNKFAPKDTYTTEQAIATVIRVYEVQTQHLRENVDFGIIGGADGPTSIIVGEITETPTEIVIGEDVAVDDFYIDAAVKLATTTGEMAADETFVSMYISETVAQEAITKLAALDYAKPKEMYYLAFNPDAIIDFYKELYAEMTEETGEVLDIDLEKINKYQKFNISYFASMVNGQHGSDALITASVFTNREGYIMPKDFKQDFALYMDYEGDYSVLVSFSKIGEGVIEARMQYVRNDENANILTFMSEIQNSISGDCVTIGKVK